MNRPITHQRDFAAFLFSEDVSQTNLPVSGSEVGLTLI